MSKTMAMHRLKQGLPLICRSHPSCAVHFHAFVRNKLLRQNTQKPLQCFSSAASTSRQFRLASPRRRPAHQRSPKDVKPQPNIDPSTPRPESVAQLEEMLKILEAKSASSQDAASLEDLLKALSGDATSSGGGRSQQLSDLDGNPTYDALKGSITSATEAEKVALLHFIKEEYEAKATQLKQQIGPAQQQEAERQLGPGWGQADFVNEVLNARPEPGTGEAISAAILHVFDDEELDFMQRFTGINWRHLESYTANDWRNPQQTIENMTKDDITFLSKVAEKMDAVNRRLEEAKKERARDRQQAGRPTTQDGGGVMESSSSSTSTSASTSTRISARTRRYRRRRSPTNPAQGQREPEPSTSGAGSGADREQGNPSTSDGSWRELFPDVSDDVFREHLERVATYQQQAQAGVLFADERSKHFQLLAWIYSELEVLAAVNDPQRVGLTEEEYRAKFEVVAMRLSELMDAMARGRIQDAAAASVVRFLDTQLVDLSGDASGIMFLQAEPEDVHRLGRMMRASENLEVLRDFTRAYAAAAPDPAVQQVAHDFQEVAGAGWWVKDEDELTYEEQQLYRVRRDPRCPVPHWGKIDLLAELDTDLLRFSRDAAVSGSPDDVFAKWYWHPVIGKRMMDGTLMTEGMPKIWDALYALMASGEPPQAAAEAFDAAVEQMASRAQDLEYLDDQGRWRRTAGQGASSRV